MILLPLCISAQIVVQGSGSSLINAINANNGASGSVVFDFQEFTAPFLMNSAVDTKLPSASSVTLQYLDATAPQTISDCDQLPTIKFSHGGNLYFSSSQSTTYSGLTLVPDGTTPILSTSPLTFENCCIREEISNPSFSQPFILANSASVTFQNCFIYKMFDASILIGTTSNFYLANSIIFYEISTTAQNPVIFLQGSTDTTECNDFTSSTVAATIDGLTLLGDGSTLTGTLAPILVITRYESVTFANIAIMNLVSLFDQNSTPFSPDSTLCSNIVANGSFLLMNIGTIMLGDWLIASNSLQSTPDRDTSWSFLQIVNVGSLSNPSSISVDNLTWFDDTTMTNDTLSSSIVGITRDSLYTTGIYPSFLLQNSVLSGAFFKAFYIDNSVDSLTSQTPQTLNNYTLPSIMVSNTTIDYALTIFDLDLFRIIDGNDTTNPPSTGITLISIQILNSQISSQLILFHEKEIRGLVGDTTYSIESYPYVELSLLSVEISNSSFSVSSNGNQYGPYGLFQICESVQLIATNFQILNNNFINTTLIGTQGTVGNVLFTTSEIANNSFFSSYIIYQEEQYLTVSDYHSDFFLDTNGAIYALVRCMFVSNITSIGNSLESSTMFQSSAPYLIINNCIFDEFQLVSSTLIAGGNFQPATTEEIADLTFITNDTIVAMTQLVGAGGITIGSWLNSNFSGPSLAEDISFFSRIEEISFSANQPLSGSSVISIQNYQASSFVYMTGFQLQGLSTAAYSPDSYGYIVTLTNVNYARMIAVTIISLNGSFILIDATSNIQYLEFFDNVVTGAFIYDDAVWIPGALINVDQIMVLSVINNTFENISIPYGAIQIGNLLEGGGVTISGNLLTDNAGFGLVYIQTFYNLTTYFWKILVAV